MMNIEEKKQLLKSCGWKEVCTGYWTHEITKDINYGMCLESAYNFQMKNSSRIIPVYESSVFGKMHGIDKQIANVITENIWDI